MTSDTGRSVAAGRKYLEVIAQSSQTQLGRLEFANVAREVLVAAAKELVVVSFGLPRAVADDHVQPSQASVSIRRNLVQERQKTCQMRLKGLGSGAGARLPCPTSSFPFLMKTYALLLCGFLSCLALQSRRFSGLPKFCSARVIFSLRKRCRAYALRQLGPFRRLWPMLLRLRPWKRKRLCAIRTTRIRCSSSRALSTSSFSLATSSAWTCSCALLAAAAAAVLSSASVSRCCRVKKSLTRSRIFGP
mmetsp:Transcript_4417/g.17372  ORF Transcript_4417/g.17372 Transcript_4417/m.17372 type:complete len:247 (+) Transcript_4417:271-1011(+)